MSGNSSTIINQDIFEIPEEILRIDLIFLSMAVITFYRKSFTFRKQGAFLISSFVGFLICDWDSWDLPPVSSFVQNTYKIVISLFTLSELKQHVKTLDQQDLFNLSVMYTFLHILSNGSFTTLDLWRAILIISPLQLVRKPVFLKNLLRPARVSAGPVSILLALESGTMQITESMTAISTWCGVFILI